MLQYLAEKDAVKEKIRREEEEKMKKKVDGKNLYLHKMRSKLDKDKRVIDPCDEGLTELKKAKPEISDNSNLDEGK